MFFGLAFSSAVFFSFLADFVMWMDGMHYGRSPEIFAKVVRGNDEHAMKGNDMEGLMGGWMRGLYLVCER